MTSAPRSERIMPPRGPAWYRANSSTRTPSRDPAIAFLPRRMSSGRDDPTRQPELTSMVAVCQTAMARVRVRAGSQRCRNYRGGSIAAASVGLSRVVRRVDIGDSGRPDAICLEHGFFGYPGIMLHPFWHVQVTASL